MKLMTKILNALTFANAGNQHEFNVLLRQTDFPPAAGPNLAQHGSVSATADTSSAAPAFRHAQGA
ncbi:MAG: hypothetical protein HY018_01220 [Hydrogenophilales bacterium]|nr:hypothetical protein [Hydrogenophilales bacterium]